MALIWLISSYKSEKIERSFKNRITHFNAESWHDFAIYTFRLVKSFKSFRVGLKRGSNTDISCDYQEIYNNTLKSICERLHRKVFCKNIFQIRTQQRELSMKKMFTCSVKDCSNQSRLNKNISYHKVLVEERKDLILI